MDNTAEEQEMVPMPSPSMGVHDNYDDEEEEVEQQAFRLQQEEQRFICTRRNHHNIRSMLAAAILVVIVVLTIMVVVVKKNGSQTTTMIIDHERSGKLSSARVLFGLHEGYSDDDSDGGRTHSLQDAQDIIVDWMKNRTARQEPVIAGAIRTETLIYPHKEGQDVLTESAAVYEAHVRVPDNDDDFTKDPNKVLDVLRNLTDAICVPLQLVICFYEYLNIEYKWTNNKQLANTGL